MLWISRDQATLVAFSAPDGQQLAFRVPGDVQQDRIHLVARTAFGFRADVMRDGNSWVVSRNPFLDAHAAEYLENCRRREQQRLIRREATRDRQPITLRGGL